MSETLTSNTLWNFYLPENFPQVRESVDTCISVELQFAKFHWEEINVYTCRERYESVGTGYYR